MSGKPVPMKTSDIVDGYTIKYHANGKTVWSKGKIIDGKTEGYWEWYRVDGTLKRSGYFSEGEPVGDWITYDSSGSVYKVTTKKPKGGAHLVAGEEATKD
jgi:antitoxin component YwqK of YwqJK toxin-antitoxin module